MRRWAAAHFRRLRRLLPSRQSSRRRLSVRTTSGTIDPSQTSRSCPSSSSVQHTNRLLATLIDISSFQSCCPPTGNTDQLKRLQSGSCRTSTRRQTRAPSPCSAFSTSVPRSTRSTRVRHGQPSHPPWSTYSRLRDWGTGHPVDRILSDGTQSIRVVQRSHFKDCTSHLRCAAGVRPGADPLYLVLGCSHRHRSALTLWHPCASVFKLLQHCMGK